MTTTFTSELSVIYIKLLININQDYNFYIIRAALFRSATQEY